MLTDDFYYKTTLHPVLSIGADLEAMIMQALRRVCPSPSPTD